MAALYLHIPHRSVDASAFATAGRRELEQYARSPFTDTSFGAVYIGGRPSRLPPSALRTLLDTYRQTLVASTPKETTLELHPSDASPDYVRALRDLGITRLSIEGRSFVDAELQAVEAPYSTTDLWTVLRRVRTSGFESASVDLTFGGPDQSRSTWKTSLQRAVDLRIPHVTLRERDADGTSQAGDEKRADRFAFTMTFLAAKGYEQYEITHFARPGHRSRYQEHVYAHDNVLGLGPGAESFWWSDHGSDTTAERWSNVTDAAAYVQRVRDDEVPVIRREKIGRTALAREYILLRLRTKEGLDLDVLDTRYDCSLRREKRATLDRLATEGLIHDDPTRIRLTDRGRLLADAITQRLMREV